VVRERVQELQVWQVLVLAMVEDFLVFYTTAPIF